MIHTELRKPECHTCPLKSYECVPGNGPIDAEILVVAEAPGEKEVEAGVPLVGWTGIFVNETLAHYGFPRSGIRVENVFQGKTLYQTKEGKAAASVCGRTIWNVVAAMPNLRTVIAFGEAALRELSGWRASDERAREYKAEKKKYDSWLNKSNKAKLLYQERLAKHSKKQSEREAAYLRKVADAQGTKRKLKTPTPLKSPVRPKILDEPQLPQPEEPRFTGFSGIGNFRGSPLWVAGYEGKIRLFPITHPAAVAPKRQPRMRPLVMADIRRATEFHKGLRVEQRPAIISIRSPEELKFFLHQQFPKRMAYDLEWSRKYNELVALGIGTGSQVGVIVFRDSSGFQMSPLHRQECFEMLRSAFDCEYFAWGGHFACSFDEGKLASVGLHVRGKWDSLYEFHILHADLGSAIDEEIEGQGKKSRSSATGYDLGFVMSVVTNMPYHKYMLDQDAAEMPPDELVEYCGLDVAGSWHIDNVLYAEGCKTMPNGLFDAELQEEMELSRRATKMSKRGVPINEPLRVERLRHWTDQADSLRQEASALVGNPAFNIGSGPQLAQALQAQGIKIRWNHETNNPMMSGNELFKLQQKYPDNKLLQVRMQYQKAQTEIRAYNQLEPGWDGKAHPSWKIHGTVGTRWSSTPNYQNLTYPQREVCG